MWEKILNALLENPVVEWVESTIGLPSPWSAIALYGVAVLVLVLIIVIIASSCKKAKKKKAAKAVAVKEEASVVEEVKE